MMAGPRLATLTSDPVDSRSRHRLRAVACAKPGPRFTNATQAIEPSTDDWPFLYLRDRHIPRHYVAALALILIVSIGGGARRAARAAGGRWSWQFFLLGAGFMLLETKSIIQFALLWGSTWVVASLAIAVGALRWPSCQLVVSKVEIHVHGVVVGCAGGSAGVELSDLPVGRIGFESRAVESVFYALLMFSPILCAGLLFGSAIKRSSVAGARLRHEPARRDGRWRGRIPVARDRLPLASADHWFLLCSCFGGEEIGIAGTGCDGGLGCSRRSGVVVRGSSLVARRADHTPVWTRLVGRK